MLNHHIDGQNKQVRLGNAYLKKSRVACARCWRRISAKNSCLPAKGDRSI